MPNETRLVGSFLPAAIGAALLASSPSTQMRPVPSTHRSGLADGPHKLALVGGPQYAGGIVGVLQPGGTTSIGDGLDAARVQLPASGANPRAMLLPTDVDAEHAPWAATWTPTTWRSMCWRGLGEAL